MTYATSLAGSATPSHRSRRSSPAAATVAAQVSDRADAETVAIASALVSVDVESSHKLREALGTAKAERNVAEERLTQLESGFVVATQLDNVLAVARPFVSNLEVLVDSLRQKNFVDHLVATREQDLLAEASRRLLSITKGRFGFVADFGVINKASGETREADALSGGERFQAAALAGVGAR